MLEKGDVVKCISLYTNMTIGSYGVVKEVNEDKANIEIASSVGNTGSFTTIMKISDLVKVGKLF